jgi:hypothetical protein
MRSRGSVTRRIYKLRVHGDVMMRPMLCRGPHRIEREYTVLLGAIEKDRKLRPTDWKTTAAQHREIVHQQPARRCEHERV